jgi:hypothetical protein
LVCDIAVAAGEADGKPALSAAALLLLGQGSGAERDDLGPWPPTAAAHTATTKRTVAWAPR